MIDLHTHSFFSDGDLVPSELARRAEHIGYRYLGISDHMDTSNLDFAIPRIVRTALDINPHIRVRVIPGVELTHVPPPLIGPLAKRARELGAAYVVVHGESPVEPVKPGTNRAAIEAGADILAHPGMITREEVELAAENGVLLEISTRKGHSLTNGHVAKLAKEVGAPMVLNSDAHTVGDLVPLDFARLVALGAGLDEHDFERMIKNAETMISRLDPPWSNG